MSGKNANHIKGCISACKLYMQFPIYHGKAFEETSFCMLNLLMELVPLATQAEVTCPFPSFSSFKNSLKPISNRFRSLTHQISLLHKCHCLSIIYKIVLQFHAFGPDWSFSSAVAEKAPLTKEIQHQIILGPSLWNSERFFLRLKRPFQKTPKEICKQLSGTGKVLRIQKVLKILSPH